MYGGEYQIIKNTTFGKNPTVWHFVNLLDSEFGDNVMIGSHVEIRGSRIGNNCRIQPFCFIPNGIRFFNNIFVGPSTVFTNDKKPPSGGRYWLNTIVEDDVSIGGGCTILPGVKISKGVMVGAGSVVTKDLDIEDGVYFGNPAKFYKSRKDL